MYNTDSATESDNSSKSSSDSKSSSYDTGSAESDNSSKSSSNSQSQSDSKSSSDDTDSESESDNSSKSSSYNAAADTILRKARSESDNSSKSSSYNAAADILLRKASPRPLRVASDLGKDEMPSYGGPAGTMPDGDPDVAAVLQASPVLSQKGGHETKEILEPDNSTLFDPLSKESTTDAPSTGAKRRLSNTDLQSPEPKQKKRKVTEEDIHPDAELRQLCERELRALREEVTGAIRDQTQAIVRVLREVLSNK
ncbi:hypothetical protein BJ138DRAFT_1116624 [Hygrophoropsis aurantiaca]|uniref:Uncharacterized protein n=1 Tax=Hygrophoropsis aurantiaca TaxID=72124 RepID=A0ACB8A2A1_9AGAM|nr:hypothetical protein BJ138DRAFT_1116624 [Hygrophoropsis aurantiaca]